MKNQLKESPEKYRNALAVFLNLAADNVETWLRKTIPDIPDKTDIVKRLKGENNAQTQSQIFSSAITHFFFLQWLYNQRNYFAKPNNGEAIAGNYQKLVIWIERLYDLRNYWSHIDHDKVCLPEEVNEVLLELYLQACAECKAKIPERYKGTEGVNVVKKEKKSDGTYAITEVTAALSLTGTVFYACLFLDGRQINDFLESMEQSSFTFEALNKRMEHRHNHPEWPYPDELSNKKKDFFYARDVYRHWKLRGHRASFAVSAELEDKEVCFGMLEYLKRCPKEALELSGIPQDKDIEKITFDTLEYEVREKDKFFDWALAFWDEEMQRLSINGWKWARHQTTDEIQGAKNELEQEAEKAGRPYHFPRYKKVVFDIPQNPEERLNYRNDEHGFTYFLLKDDNSEKATQAMFRYQRPDGKMAIGLMNGRLLCSALEWYFYKFPADADGGDDGKKEFWTKFFHACFRHVENTLRTAKPKAIVSKEQVKERIEFLRKTYGATADRQHQKLQFILSTWNQIISYGRTMNMEHANNHKGRLGAKSGYQELLRYLSLMGNSMEERRELAHKSLVRILEQLGKSKSIGYYFQVINSAFSKCRITNSPVPLKRAQTVEAHFELCRQYREKMLDEFEKKLTAEFSADDWRPAYEMRWLGLRDARTPQAAQGVSPATVKALPQTNIVNVDSGSYPAAGLPRDVRHLAEESWQSYLNVLSEGCLEKIHSRIYPSPNSCTLLIPAFYENATYTPSNKHSCSIRKHKLLYLIRRQDTVISHIAYKKWRFATKNTAQGLTLQNMDYQKMEFKLPVGEVFIRFYYRYFKQVRYQLPPKLTKKICDLLVERGIVQRGDCIDFNCLKPVDKSTLTPEEQCQKLLSQQEQALPADQKEQLRKERFVQMNQLIFYPYREDGKLYFDEILQSYIICRRAIISKIHMLERAYKVNRRKENYTDFRTYVGSLAQKGYICEDEKEKLIAIRNAAFHGDIPKEYIPQNLEKAVTNDPEKKYFDYFGEGIALVDEILRKITDSNNKFSA